MGRTTLPSNQWDDFNFLEWSRYGEPPAPGSDFSKASQNSLSILNLFLNPEGDPEKLAARLLGLQQEIASGKSFRAAYANQDDSLKSLLAAKVGKQNLGTLFALSGETDPDRYWNGVVNLGVRIRDQHDEKLTGVSVGILQRVSLGGKKISDSIRARAEAEAKPVFGLGEVGRHAEYLLGNFVHSVTDWKLILPMVFATPVFYRAKAAALANLVGRGSQAWYSMGWGAEATASVLAFGGEVTFFSLSARLLQHHFGPTPLPWDLGSLAHDWGSAATTLGILKGFSFLGKQAYLKKTGLKEAHYRNWDFSNKAAFTLQGQGAAYWGFVGASLLEQNIGLKPQSPTGNVLLDSLAVHTSLMFGGFLGRRLLGQPFLRMSQRLSAKAHALSARSKAEGTHPWQQIKVGWENLLGGEAVWKMVENLGSVPGVGINYSQSSTNPGRPQGASDRFQPPNGSAPSESKTKRFRELRQWKAHLNWVDWLRDQAAPLDAYEGSKTDTFSIRTPEQIYKTIKDLLKDLPYPTRYLFGKIPNFNYGDIKSAVDKILIESPHLKEIRLVYPDGRVTWAARTEEGLLSENEKVSPDFDLFTGEDLPRESTYRFRISQFWRPSPKFGNPHHMLTTFRKQAHLSQKEVVAELLSDPNLERELKPYKMVFSLRWLRSYEKKTQRPIPFPILRRLANLYEVDINELIFSLNRTLYPKYSPHFWSAPGYPVYLEGEPDLKRIQIYRKRDSYPHRTVGSFGWQLWALRKNPYSYQPFAELADNVGIEYSYLTNLEMNRHTPGIVTLQCLARELNVPLSQLIRSLNQTHHSDIPVEKVFGDLPIFIDTTNKNEDRKKIEGFANNPGNPGQYLFAYRKVREGVPEIQKVAEEVGREKHYMSRREMGKIEVGRHNLHDWVWLFNKLGMPLDLLKGTIRAHLGIPVQDPVYILAEGMEGRTFDQLSQETGLAKKSITHISQGQNHRVPLDILLRIKRGLPSLDAGRLHRSLYPGILEIFPEAASKDPHLNLSQDEILQALLHFNLGETLLAYRLNPPAGVPEEAYSPGGILSLEAAARQIDIPKSSWQNHEAAFGSIRNDGDIFNLAAGLGIDPRLMYLHYRPEILQFYPVRHPKTGHRKKIPPEEWAKMMETSNQLQDRSNLRRGLDPTLTRLKRKHGETEPARALAQELGIPVEQAKRFLEPRVPLQAHEIQRLTSALPEQDYQRWYEHFHRPSLAYFLGRKGESFNYEIPEGMEWKGLDALDLRKRLYAGLRGRDVRDSERTKVENYVAAQKRERKYGTQVETIVQVGRITGVDPKLIYLHDRRRELRPMLDPGFSFGP